MSFRCANPNCTINNGRCDAQHKCYTCKKHIHIVCGEEYYDDVGNVVENLSFPKNCYKCHDELKKKKKKKGKNKRNRPSKDSGNDGGNVFRARSPPSDIRKGSSGFEASSNETSGQKARKRTTRSATASGKGGNLTP